MKSYFLSCPVCLSSSQEVLFPGFKKNFADNNTYIDPFQNIVLCQDCGAVFRNPVVPDLNAALYQAPHHWGSSEDQRRYEERLEFVAASISQRVKFQAGDLVVDIGGGPGWLARKLIDLFPCIRVVLCEPAVENAKFAKSQAASLIAVPSSIEEFVTTPNTFALVTATGVDYLFLDHRAAMLKISEMMREGGTLYIERNLFVEQEAYHGIPIFDHEDMFLNNMANFWPGKQQFVEYLSTFFDILDHIEYNFGETLGLKCQMVGVFCKKRANPNPSTSVAVTNRYTQHLNALKERASVSSLADLSFLAKNGLKKVGICGDAKESTALRLLIEKNGLFEVAQLISSDPALAGRDGFVAVENAVLRDVEAIFVASVSSQDVYCKRLRKRGYRGQLFPCFRKGLPFFEAQTSAGNLIPMKAFLPSLIAGKRRPIWEDRDFGIGSSPDGSRG
jgi:trans-aconitate methyltransferase